MKYAAGSLRLVHPGGTLRRHVTSQALPPLTLHSTHHHQLGQVPHSFLLPPSPPHTLAITSQAIPPSPPHRHQLGQVSHSPGANLVGHVGHEQCVEHL